MFCKRLLPPPKGLIPSHEDCANGEFELLLNFPEGTKGATFGFARKPAEEAGTSKNDLPELNAPLNPEVLFTEIVDGMGSELKNVVDVILPSCLFN